MIDESALDYVSAALIYAVYDSEGLQRNPNTSANLIAAISRSFGVTLPQEAVDLALNSLVSLNMANATTSRFAPPYYRFSSDFKKLVSFGRFESQPMHPIFSILDRFMTGPSNWMEKALNSQEFNEALNADLSASGSRIAEANRPPDSSITLSDAQKVELIAEIDKSLLTLDTVEIANSEKAQSVALLSAARALAEAPDPPALLIWEILARLNNISGITGLMVSIIALIHTW